MPRCWRVLQRSVGPRRPRFHRGRDRGLRPRAVRRRHPRGATPRGTRPGPPAVGVAHTWGVIPGKGLGVEAELVVSDSELDSWRRRFQHGPSIGFRYDRRRTRWERPVRSGQPPRKVPRGVEIEELSLVQWAAYPLAGVTAMAQRSRPAQPREPRDRQMVGTRADHTSAQAADASKERMSVFFFPPQAAILSPPVSLSVRIGG
jgi:hypothetical protein